MHGHGHGRHLYRAIDRNGALVDVMFSEHRDMGRQAFFQTAKTTDVDRDRVTGRPHRKLHFLRRDATVMTILMAA